MQEIFLFDVFLSHSATDKEVVRPLAERLRQDGLNVWFDEWMIEPGDRILAKIDDGLEHSRVLVFCISAAAIRSDWPQLEAATFRFNDPLNEERRFIPVHLDETRFPGSLRQFSSIDWRPESRGQAQYQKLLAACRNKRSTQQPAADRRWDPFRGDSTEKMLSERANASARYQELLWRSKQPESFWDKLTFGQFILLATGGFLLMLLFLLGVAWALMSQLSGPGWFEPPTVVKIHGDGADYVIVALSQEYRWKRGSQVTVVDRASNEIRLSTILANSGIKDRLNDMSDLIAIGVSSCIGRHGEEDQRAEDRAASLGAWLRQVQLARTVEGIHLLNLGQYQTTCEQAESSLEKQQRPVVVVGVTNKRPGLNITSSFREALDKQGDHVLPLIKFRHYTNWSGDRFMLKRLM